MFRSCRLFYQKSLVLVETGLKGLSGFSLLVLGSKADFYLIQLRLENGKLPYEDKMYFTTCCGNNLEQTVPCV